MTELERIREDYPNSKVMFVFRHGDKTADGQHITPESIEDIVKNGPRRLGEKSRAFDPKGEEFYICLGSEEIRTQETAFAVATWALKNEGILQGYQMQSHVLGGLKVFEQFSKDVMKKMKSEVLTPVEALATLKKIFFSSWIDLLKDWADEIFDLMKENQLMLVPCHSPTVEAMYNVFVEDLKMKAGTLEGIFLVEKANGEIIAVK